MAVFSPFLAICAETANRLEFSCPNFSLFFSSFFGKSEDKRLIDYTDLRTVKQLAEEAPFVTESKIRWWIFHAESNGFDAAMLKIGGRVYIDKAAFNEWLESHRVAA